MKKILIVMSVAILIALCSAPLFVNAAVQIGSAYVYFNDTYMIQTIYSAGTESPDEVYFVSHWLYDDDGYIRFYPPPNYSGYPLSDSYCITAYIPTITEDVQFVNTTFNTVGYIYSNYSDYYYSIPEDYRGNLEPPYEPTKMDEIWDDFYELFYKTYGFYPRPGSLIDLLKKLSLGDDSQSTEIYFPTFVPTPTPTPTPTPIPVQTIFVPDGNGNTTIIYQYPDPTSGIITQSPYNPNITNNIDVNCNCDSDNDNDVFGTNPQDPYTLTSSMLWADGFGVEISDNPLTSANESQQTLAEAAAEYSDSVGVVSNSFNVLPIKWLTFVGLLGGILIIAGLIRTFLGG